MKLYKASFVCAIPDFDTSLFLDATFKLKKSAIIDVFKQARKDYTTDSTLFTEITCADDLPEDWDVGCDAYGPKNSMPISYYLEQQQNKEQQVAPDLITVNGQTYRKEQTNG